LRAEPKVPRRLLRQLVEPLTLWDAAEPSAEWIEWEALGYFDDETCRLEPIENPFSPKVLLMSREWT
jgi:hypothetical protein